MLLLEARSIAERLVDAMRPHCRQIEIAGSIRRCKENVKDIEIVAVPDWQEKEVDQGLFTEMALVNPLHDWASTKVAPLGLQWIKPGTSVIEEWPVRPDGKYWRGYLPLYDIKVDVFLATPANWGGIFLIRTGSAEFTTAVMGRALRLGMRFEGGYLKDRNGERTAMLTEEAVFEALGLQFIDPSERTGADALRLARYKKEGRNGH